MIPEKETEAAVKSAIAMGYRHIDTAQAYDNEAGVGAGVRNCGVPREELFVTSKIAVENKSYESAMESIDESLRAMGLDYIDMMIIHSPQPWVEVNQSENRYFEENIQVWKALEDAYKAGKVKAIGLSNFLKVDIENILATCEVKPMVNQVLSHITNTPFEFIDYCKSVGIEMEAYSPVAHGLVLQNEKIAKIAKKYGVKDYRASVYKVDENGNFTGEVKPMWDAESKQKAISYFVKKYNIDLEKSYAYGDTTGDLTMFKNVGHAIAINPAKKLLEKIKEDENLREKVKIIVERKDVIYSLNAKVEIL